MSSCSTSYDSHSTSSGPSTSGFFPVHTQRGGELDSLTGLLNRRALCRHLEKLLGDPSGRAAGRLDALVLLDLDRFRAINSGMGYRTGDALLLEVAKRLRPWSRRGDFVARVGDDEFALVLRDLLDLEELKRIAERLQRDLGEAFTDNGVEIIPAASVGATQLDERYRSPEEALRDAESAMCQAKTLGRRGPYRSLRAQVFTPALHGPRLQSLRLENEVRQAVDRNQLRLVYQPIARLLDGSLRGFEVLLRWQHPRLGLLEPKAFLDAAEASGELSRIGRWTIARASRQLAVWQGRHATRDPLSASINLDCRQLLEPRLLEWIEGEIESAGIVPGSLKLELTENAMLERCEDLSPVLGRLTAAGIDLHIDDFGTGYASLSYLHRLPSQAVKIDRSFLVPGDARMERILLSMVELSHALGMEVVAEGVETRDQLALAQRLGYDDAQGFLLAPPLTPRAAESLLGPEKRLF